MEHIHSTPLITAICDQIGRKTIADALGVGATAVSNAVTSGRFPAKWFVVISKLCEESGVVCSPDLFAFAPSQKAS